MTTPTLTRGQNAPLTGQAPYAVVVTHEAGPDVDLTGFALTEADKVPGDAAMIFYNQPSFPGVEWVSVPDAGGLRAHRLVVEPTAWAAGIVKVRIGLTVDGASFDQVRNLHARVVDAAGDEVAVLDLGRPDAQNALIVGEIYLRSGALKLRCVGDGFTDGLYGLGTDAGVDIDPPSAAPAAAAPPPAGPNRAQQVSLVKPPPDAPAIDLRKYHVATALMKNRLDGRTFRVVLAIDASGSMKPFYKSGLVQRSLERMVPIADLLDDDGRMEVWFFGDYPVRSAPVDAHTMYDYIERNRADKKRAEGGNYEPRVMQEIIDWVTATPSPHPTLVLFWSDGGVHAEKKITQLLVSSSVLPIFWMFLGLGRADYGVLARLDAVTGGVVDNAGFIPIDNIELMPDEELYGLIFGQFVSAWYAEATAAGVVRR